MTSSSPQPDSAASDATLSWSAHPAATRPKQAVAAGVVIIALAFCAGLFGGSIWWGAGALIVMIAALNRFFFPSRFTIDETGIEAKYLLSSRRLEWRRIRRFLYDDRGGYVSTRVRPSWTDAYRGIHLVFDDDRQREIDCIESHIADAERTREAASTAAFGQNDNHGAQRVAVAGGPRS